AFFTGGIAGDDASEARLATERLISGIPVEFWQENWVLKSLDTSGGRQIIADSIRRLKSAIASHKDEENFDWRIGNPLIDSGSSESSGEDSTTEEPDNED
ncbi:TPA: hypothetical protein U2J57_005378, partial [Serratia marcescens]|nr:hypothetical protein [Serratia marcescens]